MEPVTGASFPLDTIQVGLRAKIVCYNMDADRDMDCLVGNGDGTFKYFKNDDGNSASHDEVSTPVYTAYASTSNTNPFKDIDVGTNAVPYCFNMAADVNGFQPDDMDFECLVGKWFEVLAGK